VCAPPTRNRAPCNEKFSRAGPKSAALASDLQITCQGYPPESLKPAACSRNGLHRAPINGSILFISYPHSLSPTACPVILELRPAWRSGCHPSRLRKKPEWERIRQRMDWQGLKPDHSADFSARLKPCPCYKALWVEFFISMLGSAFYPGEKKA
jgi:hypothetical protein